MSKVFLDTNVILDFLMDRQPFSNDISEIFQLSIDSAMELCVSAVSITDISYIIGRIEGKRSARSKTKKLLGLIKVEPVDESMIKLALLSKFKDFEDAVQYFCAKEAGHRIIVTRNIKDYKRSEISVMTPKEFLAFLETS